MVVNPVAASSAHYPTALYRNRDKLKTPGIKDYSIDKDRLS
jgi:hypothetical protein